jgi:iron complex transport system substrate-binding protein
MFNGDWTEQSLLEKPNGLSFLCFIRTRFKANSVFSEIEREYNATLVLPKNDTKTNSSRSYVPRSMVRTTRRQLGALFLKMLKLIIYGETQGYWSASLPFEVILEKRNKQNSGLPW